MFLRASIFFGLFFITAVVFDCEPLLAPFSARTVQAQTGGVYLDERTDNPVPRDAGPGASPGSGSGSVPGSPGRSNNRASAPKPPAAKPEGDGETGGLLLGPMLEREIEPLPNIPPDPLGPRRAGITKGEMDRARAQRDAAKKQEIINKMLQEEEARQETELRAKARDMAREIMKTVDRDITNMDRVLDGYSSKNTDASKGPSKPLKPNTPPRLGPKKTTPKEPPPPEDPDRPLTEKEKEYLENLEQSKKKYQESLNLTTTGGKPFIPKPIDPQKRLSEGWCQLLDGKTFFGWVVQQSPDSPYRGGRFFRTPKMPDVICSDPQKPGLLYTTSQFGNATISLEYQCPEDAEILLLLRTPPSPRDLHTSCYTIILNSATRKRGGILGRHAGALVEGGAVVDDADDPPPPPPAASTATPGEASADADSNLPWRRAEVQFDGAMIRVKIDRNEPIQWYDVAPLGYGHIGLLVAKGPAKFRNVYWKPGASEVLFDEISLDNWWYDPLGGESIPQAQLVSRLVARDSATHTPVLQLRGPAILEHKREAKNFSLQLEYQIVSPNGQAGVYFRAKRGKSQTGYDCSIQSIPSIDDRLATPIGVDTGGIRNLASARAIPLHDIRWNYLTINVIDRHIQTWVNGVPVCNWGDLRGTEHEGAKTGKTLDAPSSEAYAMNSAASSGPKVGQNAGAQNATQNAAKNGAKTDTELPGPFLEAGTIQLHARTPGTQVQFRNIRLAPFLPRFPQSAPVDAATWIRKNEERKAYEARKAADERRHRGEIADSETP